MSRAVRPLVVVPTYNERENLEALVRELIAIEGLRVLIVDDQSPDGTGRLADDAELQKKRPDLGCA